NRLARLIRPFHREPLFLPTARGCAQSGWSMTYWLRADPINPTLPHGHVAPEWFEGLRDRLELRPREVLGEVLANPSQVDWRGAAQPNFAGCREDCAATPPVGGAA